VKKRRRPTVGERAARIALKAVGVPYSWGGASMSGFDCSGLVYWAYSRLGVDLPHSSYALYDVGRRVARSRMKPGDVLFFSGLGHVGLYLGRGRMVHAPHSGRTVEVGPHTRLPRSPDRAVRPEIAVGDIAAGNRQQIHRHQDETEVGVAAEQRSRRLDEQLVVRHATAPALSPFPAFAGSASSLIGSGNSKS